MKVLFFGRNGCSYSENLINLLNQLEVELELVLVRSRDEVLPEAVYEWSGDYLFSFRNLKIIPDRLLRNVERAAINFHPAPPRYRGSGGVNVALYNDDTEFGVTAHLMDAKVDNGMILAVQRFAIDPNDDLPSLIRKTHEQLSTLAERVMRKACSLSLPLRPAKTERWEGPAYKAADIDNFSVISLPIEPVELRRIIRAFHLPEYPVKIRIHGQTFCHVSGVGG